MLKKNNFNIIKDIEFPDHYNYKKKILIKLFQFQKKIIAKF